MENEKLKWAICGLGFIADRHIQAINHVGGDLICGCDIDKEKSYKIGKARFFDDYKKMLRSKEFKKADYVIICTPNCLHWKHIGSALALDKKVLCEKPPVISQGEYNILQGYNNIDKLNLVLQCRYAQYDFKLKEKNEVEMNIEIYRDAWYMKSWKADDKKSGGLLFNIGVHYFDLLQLWLGNYIESELTLNTAQRIEGSLKLDKANVKFKVAIDAEIDKQKRIFKINENEINLTQLGIENLHTKVYEEMLKGKGFKLKEYKNTLNIIQKIYGRKQWETF
jgi:UDP-N-acetyl-2-amino-2-deoxyglucuronate dehydrogenase